MIENITPDDLLPGIPSFISGKSRNIRLAVASASRNAGFVLENLKIRDAFDYIADASKIANPSPIPKSSSTAATH